LEERKNTDPKMRTVRKLAQALDCPLEAFFSEELRDL
jgi:DNA-binding XRE family transcriptional regulator